MSELTARVVHRDDPGTVVAELPMSWNRSWVDQLNEPGSGRLCLQNDDPALAALELGDVIQFLLDGTVRFSFLARSLESATIASAAAHEHTTVTGPGALALLDEALVYPSRGLASRPIEEVRAFSWQAPGYDDSWWATPVAHCEPAGSLWGYPLWPDGNRPFYGWIGGWPDGEGQAIWAAGSTTWLADGGDCYFRKQFDCPAFTRAQIMFVADDIGKVWLDGTLVIEGKQATNNPDDVVIVEVELDAGTHTLAIWGHNSTLGAVDIGGSMFNPSCVVCSVWTLNEFGQRYGLLVHTDDTWKVLAYPTDPPGMTPGAVLLMVVAEAQARGALAGVTCDFTAAADTDSVTWPIVGDISTRVGTDVLTFTRELCDTYVDVALNPATLVLSAWVRDGRGAPSGVAFTPPAVSDPWSGNLAALNHRTAE